MFLNFGRLVPKGLLTLTAQDKVPFESAFGKESLAAIESSIDVASTTPAGTAASPEAGQMSIEISAENTRRAPGMAFLVLIRNSQIREEVEAFEKIRRSGRLRRKAPPDFAEAQHPLQKLS
jgi:hypothetical protein